MLSAWAYLVIAYCIVGYLAALWALFLSPPAGLELLLGLLEALVVGLAVGIIGVVFAFPTLVVAPLYVVLLRFLPSRWKRRTRRVAAVMLAPPVVGSLTLIWWGLPGGEADWFLVRCLLGGLLIYGLIIPLPSPRHD